MTSDVEQRSMLAMVGYGWHRCQWVKVSTIGPNSSFEDIRENYKYMYINKVKHPVATTFPQPPVFQNTKYFQVKLPYLEPLVRDYLS